MSLTEGGTFYCPHWAPLCIVLSLTEKELVLDFINVRSTSGIVTTTFSIQNATLSPFSHCYLYLNVLRGRSPVISKSVVNLNLKFIESNKIQAKHKIKFEAFKAKR